MDASKRSLHVYGKTQAGTSALGATRGAISTSARQLLILIDGKRTIGDLSQIFAEETLAQCLDLLESQGLIKCLQHFPDSKVEAVVPDSAPLPAMTAPLPSPAPAAPLAPAPVRSAAPPQLDPQPRRHSGPGRRHTVAVAIGACVVGALGSYGYLARREVPAELPRPPARPSSATPSALAAPAPVTAPRAVPPGGTEPVGGLPLAGRSTAAAPAQSQERASGATRDGANAAPASGQDARPARTLAAAPSKTATLHVRNQVMPQLPQQARALGIESGHVAVVLHVNPQGSVDRVELLSATPSEIYDKEMERAFEQWTFEPLGIPGRMTVEVEVAPPPAH